MKRKNPCKQNLAGWVGVFVLGVAGVLLVSGYVPVVVAEEAGEETVQDQETAKPKKSVPVAQEEEETVKTGTIAGFGKFRESRAINVDTGGASPGDEASVISAGVSRAGRDRCNVKVTNTSPKNSYSVSFQVIGRNQRGAKVLNRRYNASLGPNKSTTRTVRCRNYQMQVVLNSAKRRNK